MIFHSAKRIPAEAQYAAEKIHLA